MKKLIINISPCDSITVTLCEGKCGAVESTLKTVCIFDPEDVQYNAAVDGLEALILAHACAGVDILSEPYQKGVFEAVEIICNQF
jgi:hypothetical protein